MNPLERGTDAAEAAVDPMVPWLVPRPRLMRSRAVRLASRSRLCQRSRCRHPDRPGQLRRAAGAAPGPDGRPLDVTEATALLAARGEALDELLAAAGRSATPAWATPAGRACVTYSKKVFIPLTRLCRDRCHYCTFATVPHRLPAAFLDRDEVLAIAREGAAQGCKEALFTLGDRPEERWPAAREWLDERGYDSTLDYLRAVRDRGAGGDRPAAAPQPGRAELGRAAAAQAGRAEHGHDAGDHRDPAVVGAGRPALRLAGQGARGPAAGARGRRPGRGAVHHRHPDRHRRDARPSGSTRCSRSAGSPASTATSRR